MRGLLRNTGATLTVACMLLSRASAQAPADPAPVAGPSPDAPPVEAAPPATGEEMMGVGGGDAAGGGAELSPEELEALGFGTAGGSPGAAAVDTNLKFSGFMDFTSAMVAIKKDNKWKGATDRYQSFFIGNFNLYLSKNITENVRSFGEVRFTYMPNGARTDVASSTRASTQIGDYASFNTPMRWGGIQIQRAYLEWTFHKYVTGRAGQFLTPYGIWNVDHGSPTIIPVQRPYVVNIQLFPERQTGLEFYGRYDRGNEGFGYHVTLSNGVGPASEYRDLDRNKAVGARAYWNHVGLGEFRFGGSFYYGRDTSSTEVTGIRPGTTNQLVSTETISNQFDQLNLALDLQWRVGGFHLQSEFISQQRKYTDKGRAGAIFPLTGEFLAPNDTLFYGGYLLMGYRLDWFGVMPYMVASGVKYTDPQSHFSTDNVGILLGLNVRPIDAVVAKLEWAGGFFPWGTFYGGTDKVHYVQVQLAWAF